jgi:hypothetical protein
MKNAVRLFVKLLRELSDQNAYQRYLETHGTVHSGSEWRKFSEIRHREKYSRAKCC